MVSRCFGIVSNRVPQLSPSEILQNILEQIQSNPASDVFDSAAECGTSIVNYHSRQLEASCSSADAHITQQPPSKRARTDHEQHGQSSTSTEQPPMKNPRSQLLNEATVVTETVEQAESGPGSHWPEPTSSLNAGSSQAWSNIMEAEFFSWPSAQNLPLFWPHDTCISIVKVNGIASLEQSMKDPGSCHMTLEIAPPSVELVAYDLFGVRIRVFSQRRHIYFENGANTVFPSSATKLSTFSPNFDSFAHARSSSALSFRLP